MPPKKITHTKRKESSPGPQQHVEGPERAATVAVPPTSSEKKPKAKGRGREAIRNFTPEEDVALSRAFVNETLNPINGTDRTSTSFWTKVEKKISELMTDEFPDRFPDFYPRRSYESLMHRFKRQIFRSTTKFMPHWRRIKQSKPSGIPTEEGMIAKAMESYLEVENKPFGFKHCLVTLKDLAAFDPMKDAPDEEEIKINIQNLVDMTGSDVDNDNQPAGINKILPPMGSSLHRPIGNKRAKKMQQEELSTESSATAIFGLTRAIDSIADTAQKEQEIRGLETEFRMLKELGDVEEARKVLGQIKELNKLSTTARLAKQQHQFQAPAPAIPLEILAEEETKQEKEDESSSSGDSALKIN